LCILQRVSTLPEPKFPLQELWDLSLFDALFLKVVHQDNCSERN
jgi:hypothetical protein